MADKDKDHRKSPKTTSHKGSSSTHDKSEHTLGEDMASVDMGDVEADITKDQEVSSDDDTNKKTVKKTHKSKTNSEGSQSKTSKRTSSKKTNDHHVTKKTESKQDASKLNVNIKSGDNMLAGIEDITAYINQKKQGAKSTETIAPEKLTAQDGTELLTLPGLYAIVPHAKGDHKLVYFTKDAPEGLLDDPRKRSKGSFYEKKGMKIYEVKLTMKEHSTLKSLGGESMDVWLIDTPEELDEQLKAIAVGKGGGDNFGKPILITGKSSSKTALEAATTIPTSDETVSAQTNKENEKKTPQTDSKEEPTGITPPVITFENTDTPETPTEGTQDEITAPSVEDGSQTVPEDENDTSNTEKESGKDLSQDAEDIGSEDDTKSKQDSDLVSVENLPTDPQEDKKELLTNEEQMADMPEVATDEAVPPTEDIVSDESNSTTGMFGQPKIENKEQSEVDLSTLPRTTDASEPSDVIETGDLTEDTANPDTNPSTETSGKSFLHASPEGDNAEISVSETNDGQEESPSSDDTTESTDTPPLETDESTASSGGFLQTENTVSSETQKDTSEEASGSSVGGVFHTPSETSTEDQPTEIISETAPMTEPVAASPETSSEPPAAPETNDDSPVGGTDNVLNLDDLAIEEPAANGLSTQEITIPQDTTPQPKKKEVKILGRILRGVGLVFIGIMFFIIRKVMVPPIKGIKQDIVPLTGDDTLIIHTQTGNTESESSTTGNSITPPPVVQQETTPQATGNSVYTIPELQAQLEVQQTEARRLANTAKLLDNKDAIKFSLTALLKAGNVLERLQTEPSITADEILKESEKIDFYIKQAQQFVE